MSLTYLIDQIEMIVTSQIWYKEREGSFKVAENYEIDQIGEDQYPMFVVELPFSIEYTKTQEKVTFAVTLLDLSDADNTLNDVDVIDWCKRKIQFILDSLNEDATLNVDNLYSMLSLSRYSNDITAGIRCDLTVGIPRSVGACDIDADENI